MRKCKITTADGLTEYERIRRMLETLWIIENYRKQILIRLEPLCEILTSTLQT